MFTCSVYVYVFAVAIAVAVANDAICVIFSGFDASERQGEQRKNCRQLALEKAERWVQISDELRQKPNVLKRLG